jgi:hypothetical protein
MTESTPKGFDEFERRSLVPTGISGDFTAQAERMYPRANGVELGRRAYFAELADRFENGALTDEEEAELIQYLSAETAQNHN